MTAAPIVVTALGLGFIAWVVWYFWLYARRPVAVITAPSGQEVRVRVRGGYDPDVIVVKAGRPVRLHFFREEETPCSEMVLFNELRVSARLVPFHDTVVDLTPPQPGEYNFQCQMGMLRGKIIAEP